MECFQGPHTTNSCVPRREPTSYMLLGSKLLLKTPDLDLAFPASLGAAVHTGGVPCAPQNPPPRGLMCCAYTHRLLWGGHGKFAQEARATILLGNAQVPFLLYEMISPALIWKNALCSPKQEKGTRQSHQPPVCHDPRHPALCCLFFPQCHCPPRRAAVCQGNRFSLFFVNSSLITFEIPQSVCTVIVEFDAND